MLRAERRQVVHAAEVGYPAVLGGVVSGNFTRREIYRARHVLGPYSVLYKYLGNYCLLGRLVAMETSRDITRAGARA